ncbi:hypothetical protein ABZ484_12545 [Streptomyces sp. NPDC006393]|uniref:hypothetical protein n=1 Tax=Streptomyces sp. NPDC006393 TaxID=3156763 RepID=UPI0033F1B7CB
MRGRLRRAGHGAMPDGRVWNPLGKVRNRFEPGGPDESLQTFWLRLHGRARRRVAA